MRTWSGSVWRMFVILGNFLLIFNKRWFTIKSVWYGPCSVRGAGTFSSRFPADTLASTKPAFALRRCSLKRNCCPDISVSQLAAIMKFRGRTVCICTALTGGTRRILQHKCETVVITGKQIQKSCEHKWNVFVFFFFHFSIYRKAFC